MYGLVDCNNFYVSCERVFRPELNGRPVVVLSNNDGCVISRSNEAKALGVPMGAPAFKYKEFFEKHAVTVFSSNYALYGDMSGRVMTLLADFAPDLEVYSIDESFIRYGAKVPQGFEALGGRIRRRILKCTGIPVCVGFAPTRSLAKVANRIAKKFAERTGGVYLIESDEQREKALKWLRVEDVWGIGRRHAAMLRSCGVRSAYDFTRQPDEWVRKKMTITGLRLKRELLGEPQGGIEEAALKQSISTTRTFASDYADYETVRERVVTFAVKCAEKLRAQQSCCRRVMVFLHTNPHRTDQPQAARNIVIKLPYAVNSDMELAHAAVGGLERIFAEGFRYKRAGVVTLDVIPVSRVQPDLFVRSDPRYARLMEAVDALNRRADCAGVKLGSRDLACTWKMRQEHLSGRYTTRLSDIITVSAA